MVFDNLSSSEKELSEKLGKELERVYIETSQYEFDELLNAYRSIEKKYLYELDKDILILETKRRVAELILYSALEKRLSFKKCQKLFQEIEVLDYSSLEKKANVYLIYSRHWLGGKYKTRAFELLTEIRTELDNKLSENLNEFETILYVELKRNVDSIVNG